MDAQKKSNPPDLLEPPKKSPKFSCFLDCCKPSKGFKEDDAASTMNKRVAEDVKSKAVTVEDSIETATSEAVVAPNRNAFSPQAVVEFLKMLLSFLLIESLGKGTKPRSEGSAKVAGVEQEQGDIPIIEG